MTPENPNHKEAPRLDELASKVRSCLEILPEESITSLGNFLTIGEGAKRRPYPGMHPAWFEMMMGISVKDRILVTRAINVLRRQGLNCQTAKDIDWRTHPRYRNAGVIVRTLLTKIFSS